MKDNRSEGNHKYWDDQHFLLRRLFEKDQDLTEAIELFLNHHAMVSYGQTPGGWARIISRSSIAGLDG